MSIIINEYDRAWDEALRPQPPALGTDVRIAPDADARQCDAFSWVLARANLELEFIRCADDNYDEYRIVENLEGT